MDDLDLSNRFVRMVYDFQDGNATETECISLLSEIENKHDVVLVAPGLPFDVVGEKLVVSGDVRFEHLQDPSLDLLEELIYDYYFPFLSDTHAVLNSAFPDDADIIFKGQYFYSATARAYAATYAEWATKIKWLGKKKWNYLDFYYSQGLSEQKYRWLQTLHELVKKKTSEIPVQ